MVLLLILFLIFWLRGGAPAPEVPVIEPQVPEQQVVDETVPAREIQPVTAAEAGVQTVARNFTERFGTYSTDTPFANVPEVASMTTGAFQERLEAGVNPEVADTFRAVTSRVLSLTRVSGDEASGQMVYEARVQQEVSGEVRADAEILYKTARIQLQRIGDAWLVSDFQWQ